MLALAEGNGFPVYKQHIFNIMMSNFSGIRDVLVSVAGLCVIGTTGFLAYERFGSGQGGYIASYCNVSRLQGGRCQFTVEDRTSGRECIEVSLTNKYDKSKKSATTVCSGLVGPMETKNVQFAIDIEEPCGDNWDYCDFNVESKETS